jgi:outer membrane protein assembly factor BamE
MIATMQITTLGIRSTLLLGICLMVVSACVYRIPIQQGNFLDATALVQVKKGMTRAQVRYLLGTPMVPGAFDNDRWDYDYYLNLQQGEAPRRARATVYFHNDVVDHVDSDVLPVGSDVAKRSEDTGPVLAPSAMPAPAPTSPPIATPATTPLVAPSPPLIVVPAATPEVAPAAAPASPPAR